jgi:dTDP-4-amino-4,6-dideoxygalactose transaminase
MSQIRLGDFKANGTAYRLINEILFKGRISYGPLCGELEHRFAELHDCDYGVLSNSGTSSLLVALQALKEMHGWPDGQEVLVPATTFVASVNSIIHARLKPVLVDVDPWTYAINPVLAPLHINENTVCMMPVHPFGWSADMRELSEICKQYDLKIVEDSCESMGISDNGKMVGSWGDVGVFSMYVAHILVAGVGGIGITSDEDLALRMRSLVNHGIETKSLPNSDHWDPSHLARLFRFTSIGHSFRITEFEAALALSQLEELDNFIRARERNSSYMTRSLRKLENLKHIQLPRHAPSSHMVYPIVLREESKFKVMDHLRKNEIECRDLLPLINQPCYSGKWDWNDYPVSVHLMNHGFYVPCHQYLTTGELDKICDVLYDFFKV